MDDKEKRFEDFKKAVEEGNVETMTDENNILFMDFSGAGLMLIEETHGMADFGFSAFDGGGFTGMFISREQWGEMKTKVDAFIAKRFNG